MAIMRKTLSLHDALELEKFQSFLLLKKERREFGDSPERATMYALMEIYKSLEGD